MNLVIDIGNTRTKAGVFRDRNLVAQTVFDTSQAEALLEYCNQSQATRVLLASVAGEKTGLCEALRQRFDCLELNAQTPLPFENRYTTPEILGKDRLAAVAGAQALMPGFHCLVIDCGTCIKYDLITANGEYLGGNIAPGARMRAQAMQHFTARLPMVDLVLPADFIGHSTETALQNGALRGAALEMEGFAGLFSQRFDGLEIFLTGGDAMLFQPILNLKNLRTEPLLTLFGLNHILIFNSSTPEHHAGK